MIASALRFGFLFVPRRTAGWAWGALIVLAIVSAGVWTMMTLDRQADVISTLKRDAEEMRQANELLMGDQRATERRMSDLAIEFETLSRSFATSSRRRDDVVQEMTVETTDGETPDTPMMRSRANAMNEVFRDIERMTAQPR